MQIKIRKGSNRNTSCHIVTIGTSTWYFSYDTCIAFRDNSTYGRIKNTWGPTTGRHIREMGLELWPIMSDDDFERITDIKEFTMMRGPDNI